MAGKLKTGHGKWLGHGLDLWLTACLLAGSIANGFIALLLCGMSKPVAALWALACLGLGCLFGFIFAIPRAASEGQPRSDSSGNRGHARFVANTNMEQISDWLTKLLVGAGLVELRSMPRELDKAARYIAAGLGGKPGEFVQVAAALLVFFLAWGFLGGYVITRMFFERAFNEAEDTQTDTDRT